MRARYFLDITLVAVSHAVGVSDGTEEEVQERTRKQMQE